MINYISKTPTPDEYNHLTNSVGWGIRDNKIVQEALNNAWYSFCVYDDMLKHNFKVMVLTWKL